jgi:hypothetical protein
MVVLGTTGWAVKDWIREEWYVWKLRSEDEEVVEAAAWKLRDLGTINAMGALIDALDCEGRHPAHEVGDIRFAVGKALEQLYVRHKPVLGFALSYWDGPPQVIPLLQHVNVDPSIRHEVRVAAAALLKKLGALLTPEEQAEEQAKADLRLIPPPGATFTSEVPEQAEE